MERVMSVYKCGAQQSVAGAQTLYAGTSLKGRAHPSVVEIEPEEALTFGS